MDRLTRIEIAGFKSIRDVDLELGPLNVLIGANGSGKSNLVDHFKLLNFMTTESLQDFVARSGGASSLLHYGPKRTPLMQSTLHFVCEGTDNTYHIRLVHGAGDVLFFTEEKMSFHKTGFPRPKEDVLGGGHKETLLNAAAKEGNKTARFMRFLLRRCQVFQFHDTSEAARIRNKSRIEDNQFLRSDAGNLAAYLYMLRETKPQYYKRIIETLRQVAPFFDDFDLAPSKLDPHTIMLNWRERGSDYLFGPHHLSDGTLRAMALFTLLLQPESELPSLIIVDEPELGLHPFALGVLASILRSVALERQVLVATQSAQLVDYFEPEEVIVAERQGDGSTFCRQGREALKEWLESYSLSELWQKNVIGGAPSR